MMGPTRIDDRLGLPDSSVWTALFPKMTFVRGFAFRDLSQHAVLSYPAADVEGLVRGLYSRLAASALDQLPTASTFLDDPAWTALLNAVARNDEQFTDRKYNRKTGRSTAIRDTPEAVRRVQEPRIPEAKHRIGSRSLSALSHAAINAEDAIHTTFRRRTPSRARSGTATSRRNLPKPGDFQNDDRLPPDCRGDEPVPDAAAAARACCRRAHRSRRVHRGAGRAALGGSGASAGRPHRGASAGCVAAHAHASRRGSLSSGATDTSATGRFPRCEWPPRSRSKDVQFRPD